jgi:hypothetical protein
MSDRPAERVRYWRTGMYLMLVLQAIVGVLLMGIFLLVLT